MLPQSLSEHFGKCNKTCLTLLIVFSSLSDINTTLKIGITITLSFSLHYVIATTSLLVGLHRDEIQQKKRCHHNAGCPLGLNIKYSLTSCSNPLPTDSFIANSNRWIIDKKGMGCECSSSRGANKLSFHLILVDAPSVHIETNFLKINLFSK